ncbi:CLIP domain-containing serine protease B4-like [Sabethes cyaneus]|uniref:CLIP domain-containing serine protease B4-like n=1 Tax=Sabethes cyaneus TaxID=53552 RepID=UPI00237E1447|nr:CLIP domain-containing serine protease B4-like [Sabethes cyaneus]
MRAVVDHYYVCTSELVIVCLIKMKSLTVAIVAVACVISNVGAGWPRFSGLIHNEGCANPYKQAGRCVFVGECQIVLAVLRKETLSTDDVAFLYLSECGRREGKSLVCCPNYSIVNATGGGASDGVSTSRQPGTAPFDTSSRVDQTTGSEIDRANWKLLPEPGECGVQPSYQLFNENVTKLDEQPWTALIHFGNKPYETEFECGGVLISSRYVLTAGHCVSDRTKWSNLTVRLGEWDTESTVDCIAIEGNEEFYCADPAIDVPVEKVIIHEQYALRHRPQLNDIAVLRLAEPVNTTTWIRPVCLPERPIVPQGDEQIFTLAGWGNNGCGYNSRYKIRSKLNALTPPQCKQNLPRGFRRTHDYLCAVPVNDGERCLADSGGAITSTRHVPEVGVVHEVAGLLNDMKDCHVNQPVGIFTSVNQYIDWIVGKLEE